MAAVFLLAFFFPGALVPAQADEAGIRDRAKKEILENSQYQRDLPFGDDGGSLQEKEWKRLREFPREKEKPQSFALPASLGAFLKILVYGFIVVALVLLVIWIVRAIMNRTPGSSNKADPRDKPLKRPGLPNKPPGGEIQIPKDWLARADRLAAEGKFGEALHLLLLGAIHSLSRSSRMTTKDSFTSRELLRRFTLAGEKKDAFQFLVLGTEKFLFGGQPPGQGDFESSRAHASLFLQKEKA